MWTIILEKIYTMNMLQRKGFFLPSGCLLLPGSIINFTHVDSLFLIVENLVQHYERLWRCLYSSCVLVMVDSKLEDSDFHSHLKKGFGGWLSLQFVEQFGERGIIGPLDLIPNRLFRCTKEPKS